jgi:hypothetical protein
MTDSIELILEKDGREVWRHDFIFPDEATDEAHTWSDLFDLKTIVDLVTANDMEKELLLKDLEIEDLPQ